MGIEETYLAFIFDEAMEFVANHIYYDNDGKQQWTKEPCWLKDYNRKLLPANNLELIKEMQSRLKI